MARKQQTETKAAAKPAETQTEDQAKKADDTQPQGDQAQQGDQPAGDTGAVEKDTRPKTLGKEPATADVAAFVGVPDDQVFAWKVHPDRAVIVTVAGQRVTREL